MTGKCFLKFPAHRQCSALEAAAGERFSKGRKTVRRCRDNRTKEQDNSGMKWKKYMAVFCLITGLAIMTVQSSPAIVYANELEDSIKQKQEEISKAQEERKKMQSGLSDVKKMVAELEQSKESLEEYVVQLDSNLAEIESKITELQGLISEKEQEIEETKKELEEAEQKAEEQYESMKTRIRMVYEKGETGYMELLLTSSSFGDFLNRAEYVERVAAYDREMLNEYEQNVEYVKTCQEALEEEEATLKEAKAGVEKEQQSLETLIGQKEQEITAYQGDISNKEQAIKEYEADIAAQDSTIAALEKAVKEEQARLAAMNAEEAAKNKVTYDGGMFTFPCPGYTRVSSEYGNRMHPTLGVQKFHNGVDLAAPSGTPILAAYDGKVAAAAYNSSMGNYVMIDHGDGLFTIYMHASKLYVSSGQTVTAGQQIAAVGSTGRSTGPHLHFSVRLNGSYVSPWNYLK